MIDFLLALYEGIYWRGHTEDEEILPRKQARKRNGIVETRFFGMPKLIIPHHECCITVYSVKNRKTIAVIKDIRSRGNKLQVQPRNTDYILQKKTKGKKVTIGNPKFDDNFLVLTNTDQFARDVLSLEMQETLLNIANRWEPSFQFTSKGVVLRVKPQLTGEMEYDLFIDGVVSLTDALTQLSKDKPSCLVFAK